jgi:hypothetical protein
MNLRVAPPPIFLSELGGVGERHAAFLRVVTGVADPRGMKRLRRPRHIFTGGHG